MQMDPHPTLTSSDTLPTRILMDEHRVIERVLACLEILADQGEQAGKIDAEPASDAVEFIRVFADAAHHGKEEARLFPAMEARGLPAHAGPTSVMRSEHEQGRHLVRHMDDALESAARGEAPAVEQFVGAARSFVLLLRDHIAKEDQVLFPMADGLLPPDEQQALLRAFEEADADYVASGTRARCLGIADALCERYGVDESTLPAGGGGDCFGGCPGSA